MEFPVEPGEGSPKILDLRSRNATQHFAILIGLSYARLPKTYPNKNKCYLNLFTKNSSRLILTMSCTITLEAAARNVTSPGGIHYRKLR